MPLGTTFWAVIVPAEKTNLLLNTSGERGTFGWGTMTSSGGGTVGTTATFQQFGAWAGSCAPTGAANAGGARLGTYTSGSGTDYTASVYIRAGAGSAYQLRVASNDETSTVIGQTSAFTTGGTWHRYSVSYTENANVNRVLFIAKTQAGNGAIYFDGAQIEVGSLTTYIDGDQEGCSWLGAPYQSQSVRSGASRAGGSVVALADLGLIIDEEVGAGMPPLENTAQSYALAPGASFQRSRAAPRPITLTSQLIGTTWRDFHNTRRAVTNALKIDIVNDPQPTRFWYVGGEGTVQIDAVLDGGLEGGNRDGFTERAGVRFVAYDPLWRASTDEGTALTARTSLGTTNYIVRRDALGRWGTLGNAGTTVDGAIYALQCGTDNTLYLGGVFTTLGGTTSPRIGRYFPATNTFGTLDGGGTITAIVRTLALTSQGSVLIGGSFTKIGGTTAGYIGFWASSFGTLGSLSSGAAYGVNKIVVNQGGTIFASGDFKLANGTTTPSIARYVNGAWGTLLGQSAGTVNGNVYAMTVGLDNTLYLSGNTNRAGGTLIGDGGAGTVGLFTWRNAFGTISAYLDNTVEDLATAPDGQIVTSGQFVLAGDGNAYGIAKMNGVTFRTLGSGVQTNTNVFRSLPLPDGRIVSVGDFRQSGSIQFLDQMAVWNGYTWLPLDINIQTTTSIIDAAFSSDGTLYVGGNFIGTAKAATVAQVVNTGGATVYPTLRCWLNAATGTAHLYQLVNTLTGDGIYFNNLLLQPNEEITLRLAPGTRSLVSSYRGNIFGQILPGSNLSRLRLLPGTNYISFFADNDSLVTSLYWRPIDWVAGGTVR